MKQLKTYLLLVVAFSVPLWVAASVFDATTIIPVKLPFSALQFLAVLLAAVIVTWRSGDSPGALLRRGLDFRLIKSTAWRIGVFLFMPGVVLLSYWLMLGAGVQIAAPATPLMILPILLIIYGVSAYCEQLGWTAIMTDTLLSRFTVIKAGLITGVVWAVWHVIPFMQTHNPPSWIIWQCIYTIIYRVLLTKLYVVTNRSVFATIALHATYNTAFSLLPYYGSSYNPMFMAFATLIITIVVFVRDGAMSRPQLGRA